MTDDVGRCLVDLVCVGALGDEMNWVETKIHAHARAHPTALCSSLGTFVPADQGRAAD